MMTELRKESRATVDPEGPDPGKRPPVARRIGRGIEHPFGPPTGYVLVHDGRRYAPKAVIGLACRSLLGRVLLPDEFSGGEAPDQANYVLRELGFTVTRKGESSEFVERGETQERCQPWTRYDVGLIGVDYFEMLGAELSGESYSKADHNGVLVVLATVPDRGRIAESLLDDVCRQSDGQAPGGFQLIPRGFADRGLESPRIGCGLAPDLMFYCRELLRGRKSDEKAGGFRGLSV